VIFACRRGGDTIDHPLQVQRISHYAKQAC
jgi:hypothetical protein